MEKILSLILVKVKDIAFYSLQVTKEFGFNGNIGQ